MHVFLPLGVQAKGNKNSQINKNEWILALHKNVTKLQWPGTLNINQGFIDIKA